MQANKQKRIFLMTLVVNKKIKLMLIIKIFRKRYNCKIKIKKNINHQEMKVQLYFTVISFSMKILKISKNKN